MTEEATTFVRKWGPDYIEDFKEELSSLIMLSSPSQLTSEQFLNSNIYV